MILSAPAARIRGWLGYWSNAVFYAGVELSTLSVPAFVPALFAQNVYPDAVPLAGLSAIVVGTLALALFRSRRIDVGSWPRRGEFSSLPFRVLYFSTVFVIATIGVAFVAVSTFETGMSFLVAMVAGGIVEAVGLAAFPRAYRALFGAPPSTAAERM